MKRYVGQGLGGSQEQELLSLWSWDVSPSWCGCVHPPESFQTLYCWDLMEASSHRHHQLLSPFSALLSSLEDGGGARKFQASNHGLVFFSGDQFLARSQPGAHPKVPQWNKRCYYYFFHLGIYQGFRSSVPGTQGRDWYFFFIISVSLLLGSQPCCWPMSENLCFIILIGFQII